MAQIPPAGPSRKYVRYGIPVAIAGVAAATVGLVPALADTGDPDLPKISAQKLLAKMAASDVHRMSGTVKVSTDLGLPGLPGGGSGAGMLGGGQGRGDGERGQENGDGRGADPRAKLAELASGEHTLRFATDGRTKQRVSVVEEAAEYSFIRNGNEVWTYDSADDSAFHLVGPRGADKGGRDGADTHGDELAGLTPQKAAQRFLAAVEDTTDVRVDGTAKIAGRDAYRLVAEPKGAPHSTVEAVRIAVDAETGVPLKFTLDPAEGEKAVVDIAFTKVDFGKPDAGTFRFSPPEGTDVTEKRLGAGDLNKHRDGADKDARKDGPRALEDLGGLSGAGVLGSGWDTVVELDLPGGDPGRPGNDRPGAGSPRADRLLDAFTDKVNGDFGTGRVFESTLVNALITEDGTVYAGTVTKEGLIKAAEKGAAKN
jgi:outer membrane lipoprotein-sorting protein